MTNRPDVLVVGAGAFGISVAHHLHEQGARVIVVERDDIARATSTCGAGFVGQFASGFVPEWGPDELACERYAIDFYSELHTQRRSFSFRRSGMLYLALTNDGWQRYLRPIADCDLIPSREVLSREEAAELGQIIRPDGIVGGVYHPEPVQLVARDAVRAMADRLREQGVSIETRRPVTGVTVHRGRVAGVQTPLGPISCGAVVLATAMWTNTLLAEHGVRLAYAPLGALRITTEQLGLPPDMPMLMVPEAGTWLREEGGALRWGCLYNGRHRNALIDTEPPERLEDLPMDGLQETETTGLRLAAAIPALSRYRDFSYAQGFPCYTPDKLPLLGQVPGLDGLYALTGDGECGITHGPGLGRALADVITGRTPTIDVQRYRIDRFGAAMRSARDVAGALMGHQRIFDRTAAGQETC
jgi:glycine/D-amino acid oxidase-like deaminating enzyme